MEYRKLGRTGLEVSVIGLGGDYLHDQPRETVVSVVHQAIEHGVNYIDMPLAFPEYRDNFGAALRGLRERVLLTGHLGSTVKDGQYCKTRNAAKSEEFFHDCLTRLETDHVDVLLLHNFNTVKDFDVVMKPKGLMDLAHRFKREGKARFIGISLHDIAVASRAIESGQIDVVMLPVNLIGNAMPGRKEFLSLCARRGVGLVAMKPYGGGKLLQRTGTFRAARYQTGGESFKARVTPGITPVLCLSYVLAQAGVSLAVVGVKNNDELAAALHTVNATEAERDFGQVVADFGRYAEGDCVYCNHCLPCPAVIDIGQVSRLVDVAELPIAEELQALYDALPVKASACTECGVCVERCPFGVDAVSKMRQAVELFEH